MVASAAVVDAPKQRAVASGVLFSFLGGLISTQLDLVGQKRPNLDDEVGLKMCCPDCDGGSFLSQKYVCTTNGDHGPFTKGTAAQGRVVSDGKNQRMVRLTADEVAAVNADQTPTGQIELTVHPAAQVDAATRWGDAGYRVRPPAKATDQMLQLYSVLRAMAADPDIAFIGKASIRGSEKLFRLQVWQGQMVMGEIVRPDEMAPVDRVDVPAPEGLLAQCLEFARGSIVDFDPAVYRNRLRDNVAALDAAKAVDGGPAPAKTSAPSAPSDLFAQLEASLKVALADVAPKPKPARKPRKPAEKKKPAPLAEAS